MSEQVFIALYLTINLFATFTLSKLFILFFEHTRTRVWVLIASYFAFFVLNSSLYLLVNNNWINAISSIIAYYLISLNYQSRLWKKVLFVPIIYLMFIIAELLVILFFGWLGIDLMTLGESAYIIWALLILNVLVFMIASIALQKKYFEGVYHISLKSGLPIIVLFLCVLMFCGILPRLSAGNDLLVSLSAITLMVITIFIYVFIDQMAKMNREQAQTKIFENQAIQYKKQVDLLLNQYNNIRTIRHNINGQIKVIYGLIDNENYDAAKDFIGDITKLIHGNERLLKTGFVELDCLINYKCNYAKSLNIEIEIETKLQEEIKIKHYEYISVIDNLIDNAIEAVVKIDTNEKRKIRVGLSAFKGLAYIEISNPYNNKIKQEQNTFFTSKQDGKNHGFGLQYVKNAVSKYDGKMQITYDAEFAVKIFMCNICKPD